MPLQAAKDKVGMLNSQTLDAMNAGSKYRGYKYPDVEPSLNYFVYDKIEFETEEGMTLKYGELFRDYNSILKKVNICDYVNRGVKEVWLWDYCTQLKGWESNMAGPYGDISNSDRDPNDMPICSSTYTLYDYNYGREVQEAVEDHGHQIEAVLSYADSYLFWEKFVSPYGNRQPAVNRCGNVHSPPNTKADYDWLNISLAASDCEDWKPDELGQVKIINCRTWSKSEDCITSREYGDGNLAYKVWWMQSIPGKGNNLTYKGCQLRNWWDFIGDFDNANKAGRNLALC